MRLVALSGLAFARLLVALAILSPVTAVSAAMPDRLSKPTYVAPQDNIPKAKDIPYTGTMRLVVDARDTVQGVFRVTQTIPVAKAGRLTVLYPEWLPGNHAPRGEIEKLAGLEFTAGEQALEWVRDDVDIYAFHLTVPEGVSEITARFQFVSATNAMQGRIVMASSMLNLRWHQVSLYPAGYYVRRIPVEAAAIYPEGWQAASAMRPRAKQDKPADISADLNYVAYQKTDYDTLVDSPVFAGKYFQGHALGRHVHLNIFADDGKFLKPTKSHIATHSKLVREAEALFGSQPYDRYDFLLALTEDMGGIGIEHHRSSENGANREYFTGWNDGPGRRNLLAHEITHSWNGKYRRPEGLWTPDYRQAMRDNLLWLYEGQTQFWGWVLSARSGGQPKDIVLGALANSAGYYSEQAGRTWRSVEDTTHDPIVNARRPLPYSSLSRSEDYYSEGMLVWLEADQIIREGTRGRRGLDDFARAFFGGEDGDWGQVTYDVDDVVTALNAVHPYDWAEFLQTRFQTPGQPAPLAGIEQAGYRLVWKEEPNPYEKGRMSGSGYLNLQNSLGVNLASDGRVTTTLWDSPAFDAGIVNGAQVVAVNGETYSEDRIKRAITAAKDGEAPIRLLVKRGDRFLAVAVPYNGGLRYPWLERAGAREAGLDRLLEARTR